MASWSTYHRMRGSDSLRRDHRNTRVMPSALDAGRGGLSALKHSESAHIVTRVPYRRCRSRSGAICVPKMALLHGHSSTSAPADRSGSASPRIATCPKYSPATSRYEQPSPWTDQEYFAQGRVGRALHLQPDYLMDPATSLAIAASCGPHVDQSWFPPAGKSKCAFLPMFRRYC